MSLKIKQEYEDRVIAFGKNAKPLKLRSQSELEELLSIGVKSKDQSILDLFENEKPGIKEVKSKEIQKALTELKSKFNDESSEQESNKYKEAEEDFSSDS